MKTRTKLITLGAAALAIGIGTYSFTASSDEGPLGFGPPFARALMQDGKGYGMMAGGMGMHGTDSGIDAMHEGVDATSDEMNAIHLLFADHDKIERTVTNLPNGIRTVTETDDPQLAEVLTDHVAGMIQRVGEGRDPGLPIESSALRSIFENYDKIETEIEATDKGVVVTQTSDDPQTVAFLQEHAGQVSDFAEQGVTALHRAMAENGSMPVGMMHGGGHMMHGRGMMGGGGYGPPWMQGDQGG